MDLNPERDAVSSPIQRENRYPDSDPDSKIVSENPSRSGIPKNADLPSPPLQRRGFREKWVRSTAIKTGKSFVAVSQTRSMSTSL
jgi:hypothetical protein